MMSPLISNGQTAPAGLTNGGVLVGTQPSPDGAASVAVAPIADRAPAMATMDSPFASKRTRASHGSWNGFGLSLPGIPRGYHDSVSAESAAVSGMRAVTHRAHVFLDQILKRHNAEHLAVRPDRLAHMALRPAKRRQ